MLAAHSKKLEQSMTHWAESLRPAFPPGGEGLLSTRLNQCNTGGWFFTQEEQKDKHLIQNKYVLWTTSELLLNSENTILISEF